MLEQQNDIYKSFKLTRITPLRELNAVLKEVCHLPTGALILYIGNDDQENTFSLSFQTLPKDSKGAPHILEHTVLCGSKKYPVKDPFFAMMRRSLNTFMNALTGSDFTCYPASSENQKDFYNLLKVYIDAVFHPELKQLSFKQEGHRLEFENPEDPNTPLVIRGIVYNEMKGAMNSGPSRMHETLFEALYEVPPYGVNAGGDPKEIPNLTYEELLNFHKTFYDVSRCLFFFYGNIPLETHLDFLENELTFEKKSLPALPKIEKVKRWSFPKQIDGFYPASIEDCKPDKSLISFGWLTTSIKDQEESLALDVLEIILLDNDAAPLKKALLKSRLVKTVSSYLDNDLSEIPFIINLQGCKREDSEKILEIILNTLKEILQKGIPQKAIVSALHQLEFSRSEISGDHHPFGLSLFMRSALLKQHGGDPLKGLLIHSLFESLREKAKNNPSYFLDLINKYLLNNPHRVLVTLNPSHTLEEEEEKEEKETLNLIQKKLSSQEKENIVNQAKELKEFQRRQENQEIDVLPKIELSDVSKTARVLPLGKMEFERFDLYTHTSFTNKISYVDLIFDTPSLTKEEIFYTRLLTLLLPQIGTSELTYDEILEKTQAATGGIACYGTLFLDALDKNKFTFSVGLKGKALDRNIQEMFSLFHQMLTSPDFSDKKRIEEILSKHSTTLESHFNQAALGYAKSISASTINTPSAISDLFSGFEYYNFIKKIKDFKGAQFDEIIKQLHLIHQKVFSQQKFDLLLSAEKEMQEKLIEENFFNFFSSKNDQRESDQSTWDIKPSTSILKEHKISSPVAFIAKTIETVFYSHEDAPLLNLASHLFENLSLHKKIREEGGAYGGGATCNTMSGLLSFYSYRDPHIKSTLSAFKESVQLIAEGKFSLQDLEEAKFEMFQQMDAPLSPSIRTMIAYSWGKEGKTTALRQAFRDRLFAATKEQVVSAIKKWVLPKIDLSEPVIFAGKALLERESTELSSKKECSKR